MPLDSALAMILASYEHWLVNSGDSARNAQVSETAQTERHAPTSGFRPPDDTVIRMLQMVIDGRCLVVEELDEVIGYFQQQRNIMAKTQGIAPTSKSVLPGLLYFFLR